MVQFNHYVPNTQPTKRQKIAKKVDLRRTSDGDCVVAFGTKDKHLADVSNEPRRTDDHQYNSDLHVNRQVASEDIENGVAGKGQPATSTQATTSTSPCVKDQSTSVGSVEASLPAVSASLNQISPLEKQNHIEKAKGESFGGSGAGLGTDFGTMPSSPESTPGANAIDDNETNNKTAFEDWISKGQQKNVYRSYKRKHQNEEGENHSMGSHESNRLSAEPTRHGTGVAYTRQPDNPDSHLSTNSDRQALQSTLGSYYNTSTHVSLANVLSNILRPGVPFDDVVHFLHGVGYRIDIIPIDRLPPAAASRECKTRPVLQTNMPETGMRLSSANEVARYRRHRTPSSHYNSGMLVQPADNADYEKEIESSDEDEWDMQNADSECGSGKSVAFNLPFEPCVPKRKRRPWTKLDVHRLQSWKREGRSDSWIAERLHRSMSAVQQQWRKMAENSNGKQHVSTVME